MAEIYQKDESIHEPTTAHQHPLETIPQGSQAEGAPGQHEHRDVDFKALARWFTGLFAIIAGTLILVWGIFTWIVAGAKAGDKVPSHTFAKRADLDQAWPVPPEKSPLQKPGAMPMLLAQPAEPMVVLRAQEDSTLSTYNWAKDSKGKKTGAVTIPIERAIDLTAERGLPADNKTSLRPPPAQAEVVRPGAAMGEAE